MRTTQSPSLEIAEATMSRLIGSTLDATIEVVSRKLRVCDNCGRVALPVCVPTHLALAQRPEPANAPTGFEVVVRGLRAYTGWGWIGALCDAVRTMPKRPAALDVDLVQEGRTVGLFL